MLQTSSKLSQRRWIRTSYAGTSLPAHRIKTLSRMSRYGIDKEFAVDYVMPHLRSCTNAPCHGITTPPAAATIHNAAIMALLIGFVPAWLLCDNYASKGSDLVYGTAAIDAHDCPFL